VSDSARPSASPGGDRGCREVSLRENSFGVRPAGIGDLETLAEIEIESHPDPWSRESIGAFLAAPGVVFLVVESVPGGEAVVARGRACGFGILRWAADQGEVVNLAVTATARGCGMGSALLDSLLDLAGGLGLTSIFLEVRKSNGVALALYRSRGFREVGVRRQYYSRPAEDARVLQLSLGPVPSASPELPSASEES